ncbi:unnamed protein product [Cochlearia groenlandica]
MSTEGSSVNSSGCQHTVDEQDKIYYDVAPKKKKRTFEVGLIETVLADSSSQAHRRTFKITPRRTPA